MHIFPGKFHARGFPGAPLRGWAPYFREFATFIDTLVCRRAFDVESWKYQFVSSLRGVRCLYPVVFTDQWASYFMSYQDSDVMGKFLCKIGRKQVR